MVQKKQIEAQLKRLGVTIKNWGAGELNELPNILVDGEEIMAYLHGWYDNGFATLLATTERLLLIDKKVFNLTIEDVRYDMIAEVDFNARLMDATVRVNTLNKCLRFTSMRQHRLRQLTTYVQQRVMQLRQQPFTWQQFEQNYQPQQGAQQQQQMMPQQQSFVPQSATPAMPSMPLQAPQLSQMRRVMPLNPYSKQSFTTTRHFLPKVPSRARPQ